MTLEQYIDNGLDVYYDSNPNASDSQLSAEALRLEREYNLSQPTTTPVAGYDVSLPRAKTIQEKMAQYCAAAMSAIHAAWICDDAGMKAASSICRRRAIELIDKARSAGQLFAEDADTGKAIEIDLSRRSGRFDKARLLCEEFISHNSAGEILSVVQFQKSLIDRQDDDCHSLDELHTC